MSLTVEKCIEGWTNSLKQLNIKADVVFYGDSLTYYGDFAKVFPDKIVCNLGLRGDTVQGLIGRIEQVKLVHPSIVFLMAGINDIARSTKEGFKVQYEDLLRCLQTELPDVCIVVQSLLPVNNKDFSISCNNEQVQDCNAIIEELAKGKNLVFLDLYALYQQSSLLPYDTTRDGIHLKEGQYEPWYRLIKETSI